MAGPTDVPVRTPAVAGLFYPDDAEQCRAMARAFLDAAPREDAASPTSARRWIGGIVPHAGWICSGAVAAQTIATIARSFGVDSETETDTGARSIVDVDVVVVFGAVHTPLPLERAVLDTFARWQLPGEACCIAGELRERLARESSEVVGIDDRFHLREHAVEVELPLIREALPGAAVLPVEVPLIEDAVGIGRLVARKVIDANLRAIFLASSDLTHYGPAYRFAPAGVGLAGLEWARANDRRLLDGIERFEVDRVVAEAGKNFNACGGGAIAAMLSACRELGAGEARVLRHTSSYQTLAEVAPQHPDNAVGYAAVVVG